MKQLLTILLFLVSIITTAQETTTIMGSTQIVSYGIGGAAPPPGYDAPHAYPNQEFWIVEFHGDSLLPTPYKLIKSDNRGSFKVDLPIGRKFGFVLKKEIKHLKKGQFSPYYPPRENVNDLQMGHSHQEYWYLHSSDPHEAGPFEVTKDKIITLTYYNISICYMCP